MLLLLLLLLWCACSNASPNFNEYNETTLKGHTEPVFSAQFSPADPNLIASASGDRTIRLWNASGSGAGERIITTEFTDLILSLAFSRDGKMIAAGSKDKTVRVFDSSTGAQLNFFADHSDRVWAVAWNHNSSLLVSSSNDQSLRVYDVKNSRMLSVTGSRARNDVALSLCFSNDGSSQNMLAYGSADRTIKICLLKRRSTSCKMVLRGHDDLVLSVAFSPDSKILASASADSSIKLWNVATGVCEVTLVGHSNKVLSLGFSPWGKYLVSGGSDNTVRVWDFATGNWLSYKSVVFFSAVIDQRACLQR